MSDGAAALNTAFQDYLLPVNFTPEQLHLHIAFNDVDPALSPIWFDDEGNVIAAALLGVRGKRGWIGGFGVAPHYRKQGYAKALIEHVLRMAHEQGLETVALEVLSENAPALGVYGNARFEITRRLFSFEALAAQSQMPDGFKYVDPDDLVDAPEPAHPCWQREPATLRNGAVSSAVSNGECTYALFRFNAALAQILKFNAENPQSLNALSHAMSSDGGFERLFILNEPEESPLAAYARQAGWTERFTQYEMLARLA